MTFQLPEAGYLLLILPLLHLLLLRLDRARGARLADIVGPRGEALVPGHSPRRRVWRRGLCLLGYAACIIAAMQPGTAAGEGDGKGGAVVICLDVSRSMLALDPEPGRLERLRGELERASAVLRGARLALIAYAGDAVLQAPLTDDHASFLEILRATDPLSVEVGGTAPARALEMAEGLLDRSGAGTSIVLLLSDGGDAQGGGIEAAGRLRDQGHVVHAVGVGSTGGGRIPLIGEDGGITGYLRDDQGEEVLTVLDRGSLAAIAEAGGGDFVDLGGSSLSEFLAERVRAIPASADEPGAGDRLAQNHFQWPLLLGFLLFLAEIAVGERRRS